jgi:hypothetical protein
VVVAGAVVAARRTLKLAAWTDAAEVDDEDGRNAAGPAKSCTVLSA